jgi:hypothetical protein
MPPIHGTSNAMRTWLEAHKPAASRRTHLLLAACMWSVVGVLLLFFGARWAMEYHWGVLLLLIAVVAGTLKSRMILDRTARRIVDRIRSQDDRRCIGGFLSLRSWFLVAVMMASGRLLRASPVSHAFVGVLYAAIGTALMFSSRRLWSSWRQAR